MLPGAGAAYDPQFVDTTVAVNPKFTDRATMTAGAPGGTRGQSTNQGLQYARTVDRGVTWRRDVASGLVKDSGGAWDATQWTISAAGVGHEAVSGEVGRRPLSDGPVAQRRLGDLVTIAPAPGPT